MHDHAGRRLRSDQPVVNLAERVFDFLSKVDFAIGIALLTFPVSRHVDQTMPQNLFDPRQELGFAGSFKLVSVLMGLHQRLLHDIRRIHFLFKVVTKMGLGQ